MTAEGRLQELSKIRVTWQLAVIICALFFIPIAGAGLVATMIEPSQRPAHGVEAVCGLFLVIGLLLSVWAIRSRLSPVTDPDERTSILRQIGSGVLVIAAAAGLTVVSYCFTAVPAFGTHWFLYPSGLYVIGLVMIGKAMVPNES